MTESFGANALGFFVMGGIAIAIGVLLFRHRLVSARRLTKYQAAQFLAGTTLTAVVSCVFVAFGVFAVALGLIVLVRGASQ